MSTWSEPRFTAVHLIVFAVAALLPIIIWYLKTYRGKLMDRFNLMFRRAKTIKVNLKRGNRTIERYIVPDKRGIFQIGDGIYTYISEMSDWNTRYGIPEITVVEGQVVPPIPDIIESETEQEVIVRKAEGITSKELRKVPFYMLTWKKLSPEKLKGLVAEEIKMALNSHIVEDVLTASDKTMKRLELMFFMQIGMCILLVLIAIGLFMKLGKLEAAMEVVKYAATQAHP